MNGLTTPYNDRIIVGFGMVGKATAYALDITEYIDRPDGEPTDEDRAELKNYHEIYLCVPTPTENGTQDLSNITTWLDAISEENSLQGLEVVIRSTVLASNARKLVEDYPELNLIFWPEFLTERTALHDTQFPQLFVVGSDDMLRRRAFARKTKEKLQGKFKTIETTPETACMIKYAMNTFFGVKVILANQFFDAAQQQGADYDQIKRALEHHKWGSRNGWNVFHGGSRGFGGKCLPKDIEAFGNESGLKLLENVLELNNSIRSRGEQTVI